jgi:glucokinase
MSYAGVDLGATRVRAVVGGPDGVAGRAERATPRGPGGVAVTEAVLATLREACETAGVAPGDLLGVGIGSIGPLDLAAGSVEDPANLPVERVPLTGPVGELVDAPVSLHNDTAAGVIGERYYSDRSPDDMVYLTISSGVGAGVAVDGRVLSGWDGNAGEVGHYVVDPRGRAKCGCGRRGHWEAYCSGDNLPAYARLLAEDHPEAADSVLAPFEEFDAADVFDAAARDDPFADHVVERVADWNAVGLTNVVHAFAPLVVYVGGAVALNNPDQVLDPVRERLAESVITNVPELRPTTLGEDAVVRGALAAAITGGR